MSNATPDCTTVCKNSQDLDCFEECLDIVTRYTPGGDPRVSGSGGGGSKSPGNEGDPALSGEGGPDDDPNGLSLWDIAKEIARDLAMGIPPGVIMSMLSEEDSDECPDCGAVNSLDESTGAVPEYVQKFEKHVSGMKKRKDREELLKNLEKTYAQHIKKYGEKYAKSKEMNRIRWMIKIVRKSLKK